MIKKYSELKKLGTLPITYDRFIDKKRILTNSSEKTLK